MSKQQNILISGHSSDQPCCEAASRIEQIPGDASSLIGWACTIHGDTKFIKLDHGKTKYNRTIYSSVDPTAGPIQVDVYSVIDAYKVTCPAIQHVLKKLLCSGIRGKGDKLQDLKESIVAIQRAITFAERDAKCEQKS